MSRTFQCFRNKIVQHQNKRHGMRKTNFFVWWWNILWVWSDTDWTKRWVFLVLFVKDVTFLVLESTVRSRLSTQNIAWSIISGFWRDLSLNDRKLYLKLLSRSEWRLVWIVPTEQCVRTTLTTSLFGHKTHRSWF